jgi:hypothetical protein
VRHTQGTDAELSTRAVLFDAQRHGLNEAVSKAIITQVLENGGDDYEGQPRFKLMVSVSNVSLFAEIVVEADTEDAARDLIEADDERARDLLAGAIWQLEDDVYDRFGTARVTPELFTRLTADIDNLDEVNVDADLTVPASEAAAQPVLVTNGLAVHIDGTVTTPVVEPAPAPVIKSWDVTFKYGEPVRYHEVTGLRAATAEDALTQAQARVSHLIGQGAWRAIPEDAGTIPVRFSDGSF